MADRIVENWGYRGVTIDASEKNNFEKETRQIESDKSSNIGINYLATMAKYSVSSKEN